VPGDDRGLTRLSKTKKTTFQNPPCRSLRVAVVAVLWRSGSSSLSRHRLPCSHRAFSWGGCSSSTVRPYTAPAATTTAFSTQKRISRVMSSKQPETSYVDPESDDIRSKKKSLRKKIRDRVKAIATNKEEIDQQSNQVWARLFELDQYKSAKSIGLFLSMPQGEINTDPALRHALEQGKTIFVPQVGQNFEKCEMELLKIMLPSSAKEGARKGDDAGKMFHSDWPRNKWGIPEPPSDMPIVTAQPGDIDLLVVPGLGFDRKGNRLGQGKGYYDRFIARMTQDGTALPLVAVALTPQLVVNEDIPVAEYDRCMDMVLLPAEIIESKRIEP
jgi:5-formyltetrahydrofolate cyclo-ligase